MSTSLRCHTCQDESPPCFRTFFDLTLSLKGQNLSIDELFKAACSTSEEVTQVHCSKCWLAQLKKLAKDLPDSLKESFLSKIKELEELPGCDFDEACNLKLLDQSLGESFPDEPSIYSLLQTVTKRNKTKTTKIHKLPVI